jgi:bifunctional DNase/RNase
VAIDARPSDAIALLRTRSPIFVEDTVIEHAKTAYSPRKRTTRIGWHKWLESL